MGKILTEFGTALPPAPRHSITVHAPGWQTVLRLMDLDPTLFMSFKSMYPRMIIHRDIQELAKVILTHAGVEEGTGCLLFSSLASATECVAYATSPSRKDPEGNPTALSPSDISIRIFDIDVRYYAVLFPAPKTPVVHPFWVHTGVGISSRRAEESLLHTALLREAPAGSAPPPTSPESPAHTLVRERIAGLLERAPAGPPRGAQVAPADVFLFPTGMAAIYAVHKYLLAAHGARSVLFGFAFHSTIHVFEDFGPGCTHLGRGDAAALDELEAHLKAEAVAGRRVQAVWAEFPSNPLLVSPDLARLRALADAHRVALVVDDTIGSFANVDVLGAADVVVTSLTKSFSGYADVMGGSAALNPSSPLYAELKALFAARYESELADGDAAALERNSRDYLARSAVLNANAEALAAHLHARAADPACSVARVHYPTTNASLAHYAARMRAPTPDFAPGHGCLLSVEFASVGAARAFYDALDVHQGPHLGAHLTLAMPYAKVIYGKQLAWAGEFGLLERQVRVSVGLEDTEALLGVFAAAVAAADAEEEAVLGS
ncbi:hypothetical protein HWV62_11854 [Athelia sp. TMB]|nr:hypothetical protein HWV62_11854 [Athelia sp. TMB]